jgi:hypothetical protein
MTAPKNSYVNLKYFAEFNKYTMALAAGIFVYVDKLSSGSSGLRTVCAVFAAVAIVIGLVIMSVLGRIEGDDIHYTREKNKTKIFLFKIISRGLIVQLAILVIAVAISGYLSLMKIWA